MCVWRGEHDGWSYIDENERQSVGSIACRPGERVRGVGFHMSQRSLVPDAQSVLCCTSDGPACAAGSVSCAGTKGIVSENGPLETPLDCCSAAVPSSVQTYSKVLSPQLQSGNGQALSCINDAYPHLVRYSLSRSSPTRPLGLTVTCAR